MNLCALFAAVQNPVTNYWHKLTDRTFSGIYHANAFDLMMMIPYFIVLIILAVYGLHRYWLVYDYYKYRKNVPGPRAAGGPLAPRHRPASDFQRALRDRAAGSSGLEIRLPGRTARRAGARRFYR
jgi:hypothetical protein